MIGLVQGIAREYELIAALAAVSSIEDAARLILERAAREKEIDCGGFYLVDERGGLELVSHLGLDDDFIAAVRHYGPDSKQSRLVAQQACWYRSDHEAEAEQHISETAARNVREMAVVPIVTNGRVGAALIIASSHTESFEAPLRRFIETLAVQVAGAVARLKAQGEAARRQQYLESLLDTVPAPIFFKDRQGRYVGCNEAFAQSIGHRKDQIIGATVYDVAPAELAARYEAQDEALFVEGGSQSYECDVRFADGDTRRIVFHKAVYGEDGPAGLVGVMLDMTVQAQIRAELERTQAGFSAIVDKSPVAIVVTDRAGMVLFANPVAASVLGGNCQDVPPDPRGGCLPWPLEAGSPPDEVELPQLASDDETGERRHAMLHVTETTWAGEAALLVVLVDITKRKRAEAALRESEDKLIHAQRMDAIGRMAGGIAHDFNNLLAAIIGNCEIAMSKQGQGRSASTAVKTELEVIHRAGHRAADLTRQLLAFSRRQVLTPVVFEVNEAVRAIERLICRLIGEHITVTTSLSPTACHVRADRSQFDQIIVNLAVNARDAMPRGGELTIASALVSGPPADSSLAAGEYVQIVVSDNGCGMDSRTSAQAFEPFFTTKEQGKGTGLGLATVYGIVTQSGGHIALESRLDQGTTFTIWLPRVDVQGRRATSSDRKEAPATGHETVLVVEDAEAVREVACRILELQGYTVLAAADGDEARQSSRAHQGPISLMVSDVVLPSGNGHALFRELSLERPEMKVLLISGYTAEPETLDAIGEGAVPFLPKPFTVADLARAVREVLDD